MQIIKRPSIIMCILGLFLTCLSFYIGIFCTKYVADIIVACVILMLLNYGYWWCLLSPTSYIGNKQTITFFEKENTALKPVEKVQTLTASEARNLSITADKRQEYIRGSSTDMTFQLAMRVIHSFAEQGLYHAALPELLYFPEIQNKLKDLGYDLQDYSVGGVVYKKCKVIWG